MGSVSILHEGEVDPNIFVPWLNEFVQREGADILRCKGIVAFTDEPKRFVFQGVHMILDGDLQRDWRPDEKRSARLVFIGRKLNEETIREASRRTCCGGCDSHRASSTRDSFSRSAGEGGPAKPGWMRALRERTLCRESE